MMSRRGNKVVMTIEKDGRPHSPVHLHVDESTPVHVHVKKPKKVGAARSGESHDLQDRKSAAAYGASNLRRSTATARARSKSPGANPWVPPPGKTTKNTKYSWEGAQARLEIATPQDAEAIERTLHMSDLSTDEEDRVGTTMRDYEKKIDSLMTEVGTLKNEVSLQRSTRELEKKETLLESSRRELDEYKQELEATEKENEILRRSMDRLIEDTGVEKGFPGEQLMKKLIEVEMDGQAASKQVAALKDTIRRLREEKRMPSSDSTMLAKQKELLLERLSDFEMSNRTLRKMLRDRHEEESAGMRLSEQRDLLLRKLSETEDNVHRLKGTVIDRDRQITELQMQLEAQREENVSIANLQSSLESTRGHLQKQLRQKDADCNRMAVQIRSLETQLAQEKIEVDHLQELLRTARDKSDRDKEALKKATRVQKQRATRSEDAVGQLNVQLMERDSYIAEVRSDLDNLRLGCDKLSKEKAQVVAENSALQTRVSELESILERIEETSKQQMEQTTVRLHEKTSEAASMKLENDRLKMSLITIEDKLVQAESEVAQLRSSLKQYEALVDEYRSQHKAPHGSGGGDGGSGGGGRGGQASVHASSTHNHHLSASVSEPEQRADDIMNRSRREADDTMIQLDEQKRETSRVTRDSEAELEKVKVRLHARLQELEPIPEMLKTTELRLQDANERLLSYEKRNTENTKLISELTAKVEHQSNQLDQVREKFHSCQDEVRSSATRVETFDRKLRDLEDQNRELLTSLAKREEALHQTNMRLEEKTRENASLNRQLEAALADARRLADQVRDKASCKERTAHNRILDLESQLSQARADIARIKREKEESERKFNSRLYDLKDRLEQSHSTNRSMQNYVQFLKSSYANVFGDNAAMATSPLKSTYPF